MSARLAMVAVLLAFAACGGGDDDAPTAAPPATVTADAPSPQPTATAGAGAAQPTATAPRAAPTATAGSTTTPSITRPKSPECGVGAPKNQPPGDIAILPGATLYASAGLRFDAAIDGTAVA